MDCPQCKTCRINRLNDLAKDWASSDATDAGSQILINVDSTYAQAFYILGHALAGTGPLPPRFQRQRPINLVRLRFSFVDAPIMRGKKSIAHVACSFSTPVDETGRAISCKACGFENHTVLFNVRFAVLCSHILSHIGCGQPTTTPFPQLFDALLADSDEYRSLPAPYALDRNIVWAGIGTVLGHELGHILPAQNPEMSFFHTTAHRVFQKYIRAELDADRQALRTLISSQIAAAPLDRIGPIRTLIGAELVARAVGLLEQRGCGATLSFERMPLLSPGFYPSPLLRWQNQAEVGMTMGNLGHLDIEYWLVERERIFTNWQGAINATL